MELARQYSAPIPLRYRDLQEWYEIKGAPDEVMAWLAESPQIAGFALLGPPGTGKTTTACWAAQRAQSIVEGEGIAYSVGYVTSLKYQHALQARISLENMARSVPDDRREEHFTRYENIRGWTDWLRTQCDLLVFDDWGKEHTTQTGFIEDEIEYLLRDRFDRSRPTILTSNMGLNSIKSRFGDAMASFVHEAFPPVALNGLDRRR